MNRVADKNGMIARRATLVAATTRYWRSQPIAGVAACCHSRTSRFAHRVMAAVILRCQGAQHSKQPFLLQPLRALALRAVCGVRLLMKQLAIRLSWQTTPAKSLVIAKGITIRVVAFLACSLADTLLPSGRLREARRGRHSRTGGSRPPCQAAYPAKPSARPCRTRSEVPYKFSRLGCRNDIPATPLRNINNFVAEAITSNSYNKYR